MWPVQNTSCSWLERNWVFLFFSRNQGLLGRWQFQSEAEVRHTFLFQGNLNLVSASTLHLSTSTSCWVLVETEKLAEI